MQPVGPELLGQVLDEHGPALRLYARQWCRCPDDVVQQALLQLMRQREPPHNLVPWLYRVVRNAAISAWRAEWRRKKHEEEAAAASEAYFAPSGGQLDAETASAALAKLPQEEREVVVARLWGGLSFEDLGELTGTSTSTAHRRYETGLRLLRESLGVACPPKKTLRT